uniref:Uncharacterized protein n=1 Tax=Cyprinodon variegatus TaxID=28743 RepID=A0A3Q2D0G4_CYPVA
MPGIFPTRLTTILSLLLPVRTFTALLMVMLSRLTPFTSTSLSPTVSPACSADMDRTHYELAGLELTIYRCIYENDPAHGRGGPVSVALLFSQLVACGASGTPTLTSIAEVGVPASIRHLAPGRRVK